MVEFLYSYKEYNPILIISVIGLSCVVIALILLFKEYNEYYIGSMTFCIGIILLLSTLHLTFEFEMIEVKEGVDKAVEEATIFYEEIERARKNTFMNIAVTLDVSVDDLIITPTEKTNTQGDGIKLYTVYVNGRTYIFKIKETEVLTYSKVS